MPQNAAHLNRLQIREQEALNQQRRVQDEVVARREAEAVRRTQAQYNHVASHGYGRVGDHSGARVGNGGAAASSGSRSTSADVQIRVYVRECDEEANQSFCYRESATASVTSSTAGPRSGASVSTSVASHGAGRGVCGVLPPISSPGRRGAPCTPGASAASSGGGRTADMSAAGTLYGVTTPNRGRVPRYLQQRKAELAAEKEAFAAEAERQRQLSLIPAGQRRISEEEKAVTLRQLDERQQELEGQLGRIPIRFDTQSIQQRRRTIEEELRQIEVTRSKYNKKGALFVPLC
ncbi:hypothetical protein LPMP_010260 [Leishmania panamensis]|uniref:Flagellar/basal body protein, putative n=1 Tax=Leishmania panamensis TaxID=5679 RepID=A0A088RGP8_LEIPA|nr:hypothetical protein LPMP_010260 [Leishmania panamensis]AIN95127.1 hypothetical protein LPMP_010260 [Leishmania panamensis]CCM35857.1 hypothetical protein, conserved [Leishmania guyanensis]